MMINFGLLLPMAQGVLSSLAPVVWTVSRGRSLPFLGFPVVGDACRPLLIEDPAPSLPRGMRTIVRHHHPRHWCPAQSQSLGSRTRRRHQPPLRDAAGAQGPPPVPSRVSDPDHRGSLLPPVTQAPGLQSPAPGRNSGHSSRLGRAGEIQMI